MIAEASPEPRQAVPARRNGAALSTTTKTPLEAACHFLLAPLVVSVVIALTSRGGDNVLDAGVLSFVLFLGAALLFRSEARWAELLPLMGTAYAAAAPLAGLLAVMLLKTTTSVPGAGLRPLLAGSLASVAVSLAPRALERSRRRARRPVRTALIGSADEAERLARDLTLEAHPGYLLVGRIGPAEAPANGGPPVPRVGELAELGAAVTSRRIELLVVGETTPRPAVFAQLAESCLHLRVSVCELAGFYEDVFGRVPVPSLDAGWFGYLMHPRYRPSPAAVKRGLDVALGGALALVTAPLLAALAVAIRLDGGPALFRQVRIGEGGRPFTLLKLRTMHLGSPKTAQWAAPDDPRITPVGRLLRRSHLDELPQLLNVLRGDMSLVGPRPEQPAFVARLEQAVPFYTHRHLVKPGVTGWAQVRCGYAGSDIGSMRKLCHDLFYVKHRSLLLDLVILGETLRTLVADRQFAPVAPTPRPPDHRGLRRRARRPVVAGRSESYGGS